tara:strand:+ start:39 stop:260 length:222 start_codon:yes stop_codon:yes gene_type:complete
MDIRKISIGPDYKSGAMHYLVGQDVLGGSHHIHHIKNENGLIKIWIQKENEIFLWKEFTDTMPISIEYNIFFE